MKRTVSFLLIIVSLCALLASCGKNELIGTWVGQHNGSALEISFEENGVCGYKYEGRSYLGTWKTADGKLTVVADDAGASVTFIDGADYTVSEGALTISQNGKATALTKNQ